MQASPRSPESLRAIPRLRDGRREIRAYARGSREIRRAVARRTKALKNSALVQEGGDFADREIIF